jgi:hypothetical protein
VEDQSERGWRAGVTGNGRGLTRVSPRSVHWAVSDGRRQISSKSGWDHLSEAVDWNCLDLRRSSSQDWPSNHTESDFFAAFRQHSLDSFRKHRSSSSRLLTTRLSRCSSSLSLSALVGCTPFLSRHFL